MTAKELARCLWTLSKSSMEALVMKRESGVIVDHYVGVEKINDAFDDRGLLCYCILLEDGSTATFNKIDYKVFKKVWVDA